MSEIISMLISPFWWYVALGSIVLLFMLCMAKLQHDEDIIRAKKDEDAYQKNCTKQRRTIILFGVMWLACFFSYFFYWGYIANNPQNFVQWERKGDEITFTSNHFMLKSGTYHIEAQNDEYYLVKVSHHDYRELQKSVIDHLDK